MNDLNKHPWKSDDAFDYHSNTVKPLPEPFACDEQCHASPAWIESLGVVLFYVAIGFIIGIALAHAARRADASGNASPVYIQQLDKALVTPPKPVIAAHVK